MLAKLLTPGWSPGTTVAHLSLDELEHRAGHSIGALVIDVDRTLLPRRQSEIPPSVESWLRQAQVKLPIHLLSNNPSRRRIASVADPLGLPYTISAAKPRRGALRRVIDDLGLAPAQVALLGDRLFTDVLAGNRLGLFTVLVKPIDPAGQPCRHDHLQNLELRMARWLGTSSTF
ncbi:MAG: YqeG family HAD IIIA-type phosphatase [Cyanobacteria bacterium]|jgi:HAD superfamily phosphatase (TIGR01668 family)|nr:YqeG family HAD IIIA-type phosphatase [Cyanobacteriota bacterium]